MEFMADTLDHPAFSCVVVAPTYNNGPTLRAVLEGVGAAGLPACVVDDGSTDQTAGILEGWRAEDPATRRVVTQAQNRGKAAAMLRGFAAARGAGYSHALTIDTDGQLDPAEAPALVAAARDQPRRLVLGHRDDAAADYPGRSRFGRRLSNLAVLLETGRHVRDSQCGFRVYPLGLVSVVRCRAGRYAYETEVITRSLWAGADVVEVLVTCRYEVAGGRVSHYRLGRDSLQGLLLHARLIGRTLMPLPHARVWADGLGLAEGDAGARPMWRRGLHWLNPFAAWRGLRRGKYRREELAVGLSIGVFVANLPIYGLHTVSCLYVAGRLHLNPHLVVIGSSVATPPLGPVLIAAAIMTGHFMLHGRWHDPGWSDWSQWSKPATYGHLFLEWCVGSLVVGALMALLTLVGSYSAFGWLTRRRLIAAARLRDQGGGGA